MNSGAGPCLEHRGHPWRVICVACQQRLAALRRGGNARQHKDARHAGVVGELVVAREERGVGHVRCEVYAVQGFAGAAKGLVGAPPPRGAAAGGYHAAEGGRAVYWEALDEQRACVAWP